MRKAALALLVGGVAGLTPLLSTGVQAAPTFVPQVSEPAIQLVWYDRWGRWHPPYYGYGYGYGYAAPRFYAYGPPPPYRYWRYRRRECFRWGAC